MGKQFTLYSAEGYSEPCQESKMKLFQSLSRTLTFQNIFAKLKISPSLFEKIPSFVYLMFKNENK